MPALNLTSIHKGEYQIAAFALKRDAIAFAKRHGWRAKDVSLAYNRFCAFYVIGQGIGTDVCRLVRKDGSVVDLPHPGFC